MDSNKHGFNLFGNHKMNESVPVHSTPGMNSLSPYLNFDPKLLNPNGSQFILPEGQKEKRGRLELMFFTIGGSVISGSMIGSISGLYRGIRETRVLTGSVRTSSIINYIARQGATTASAMGSIALIYSLIGTGISWTRGIDDELNTVASGSLTGLLYRSTAGLKGALRGSLYGFGVSSLYVLLTSKERLQTYM
ncbi:unnamed protein product [Rotaria sordida]|uniref:Mitochondrial import inner membrane translocase subunit Tim23 n=1 Tax=Rotaria sordida TaxID=392033 RepID=A0A813V1D1_9BILA|nr:unnamed protein product [Rotaria sordida]CAF0864983.1 unnamed protein product [Rotaria sordida]CAF0937478.1 unnamed protein product [Rotaria sordida]CAF0938700.1 unnamed protein product [Rotaria sordida]CAF1090784.1 unnamed protein product [Rotaria sordida]